MEALRRTCTLLHGPFKVPAIAAAVSATNGISPVRGSCTDNAFPRHYVVEASSQFRVSFGKDEADARRFRERSERPRARRCRCCWSESASSVRLWSIDRGTIGSAPSRDRAKLRCGKSPLPATLWPACFVIIECTRGQTAGFASPTRAARGLHR